MLEEGKNVRQRSEEGFRRWFFDKELELILWYEKEEGALIGFQLCYDKSHYEKAFSYFNGQRSHRFVSHGLEPKSRDTMATGILMGDAGKVAGEWIQQFRHAAQNVDKEIIEFILKTIDDYNTRGLNHERV